MLIRCSFPTSDPVDAHRALGVQRGEVVLDGANGGSQQLAAGTVMDSGADSTSTPPP